MRFSRALPTIALTFNTIKALTVQALTVQMHCHAVLTKFMG